MSRVNESRIYHIRNDKMGVQGEKTSYTLCGFRVPNKQIADNPEHATCFACLEKSGWGTRFQIQPRENAREGG